MILSVINNSFKYETENVLRIFFPLEKIKITDTLPDAGDEDYAVAEVRGDDVSCRVKLGDKYSEKEKKTDAKDGKTLELLLAQTLFDALVSLTGYTPSWGVLTGVRPSKLMRSLISSSGEENAKKYFKEKLFVSDEKTDLALKVAKAEEKIISLSRRNSYSLYISIPFCPTRCSYCSFVSHSIETAKKLIPDYVKLLREEIRLISVIARELDLKLETVYFGGGTPTSLDEESLKAVTDAVKDNFRLSDAREYTIEAGRPDTLNREKLRVMKNAGVTRISINPQSFNDGVLKAIGRNHTCEDTIRAFNEARSEGFDNINMDFIAGLPSDTPESFRESIDKALSLSPENITVHTLALKRASSISVKKEFDTVCRDTQEMLAYSSEKLDENGYAPYYMYRQSKSVGNNENVGYAENNKECLYNIYMMEEVHSVLAAGAGGVTKLKAPDKNLIERIFNFKYPYEYINRFDELMKRKEYIKKFTIYNV